MPEIIMGLHVLKSFLVYQCVARKGPSQINDRPEAKDSILSRLEQEKLQDCLRI
jgi:hypothetical protein